MGWCAGVDIGGTKVAVSLARQAELSAAGPGGPAPMPPALHHRRQAPTVRTGPSEALAQQVMALVDAACGEAGIPRESLAGVGVSSCGPFVRHQGQIELAAPNLCGGLRGHAIAAGALPNDWVQLPLQAPLQAAFGKVALENDCVAALQAERRWGALAGLDHCAYVTWSTGIGTGLCVDGRLLRGKNGNAGHAGHQYVSDSDEGQCGCGNIGDVEGLVSGAAIQRRWQCTPAELMQAARAGDTLALQRVDELCRVLGRMLYNLVVTLDLQRIAVGGSVFLHQQALLLPRLRAQVQGRLPSLTGGFELVAAGLGLQVADLAALSLVAEG